MALRAFALFTALCLAVAGLIFGYRILDFWSGRPHRVADAQVLTVEKGERLATLASDLADHGVVTSSTLFRLWVKQTGDYPRFQAGTYQFQGSVTPRDVVQAVVEGKTYNPVVLQYTIPEGFNLKQIIARLVALDVGTAADLWSLARDPRFLAELHVPSTSLEGYLFPATYTFNHQPTPREVFQKAVETFFAKLPSGYEQQASKLGLSLEQAITFASLIELETPHEDEKPLISEVIWRRLKDNSPLGIDAALIYGIRDYAGDIRWKDIKDAQNPYNTRIHIGLPPTPIGSPSLSSLLAVLTPAAEGNYYYVLRADGSTRHLFSKTLAQHNKYVNELIEAEKHKSAHRHGKAMSR